MEDLWKKIRDQENKEIQEKKRSGKNVRLKRKRKKTRSPSSKRPRQNGKIEEKCGKGNSLSTKKTIRIEKKVARFDINQFYFQPLIIVSDISRFDQLDLIEYTL